MRWRRWHLWLGWITGIQWLLWGATGLYMVWVNLDFIHGKPLVDAHPVPLVWQPDYVSPNALKLPPTTRKLTLTTRLGHPVYEVQADSGSFLLDASNGLPFLLGKQDIGELAKGYYRGKGTVESVTKIDKDPPRELGDRPLPVWRVNFHDAYDTTLYLTDQTGSLLTQRHRYWRWFDVAWSLHIMDYSQRSRLNLPWFQAFCVLSLVLMISGSLLWLRTHFKRAEQ
ncbi:PepSY domain-containing protein [Gallaecimonas mangrovi]|uniref:PepSY domain-containing protein n=1 Tax=Gallaecimonas mangrovi TaxID=2291597 RepID=UPI000E2083AB|nr:PepSY domain-containing protein [Gallaecimonas mangrovi]